jgi:hypothetical protein
MKTIPFACLLASTLVMAPAQAEDKAAAPAPVSEAAKPVFSVANSRISEILDNADAKAIVERHLPGFSGHPQIGLARDFSLKAIQSFAPDKITDEALEKIEADFAALAAKK